MGLIEEETEKKELDPAQATRRNFTLGFRYWGVHSYYGLETLSLYVTSIFFLNCRKIENRFWKFNKKKNWTLYKLNNTEIKVSKAMEFQHKNERRKMWNDQTRQLTPNYSQILGQAKLGVGRREGSIKTASIHTRFFPAEVEWTRTQKGINNKMRNGNPIQIRFGGVWIMLSICECSSRCLPLLWWECRDMEWEWNQTESGEFNKVGSEWERRLIWKGFPRG